MELISYLISFSKMTSDLLILLSMREHLMMVKMTVDYSCFNLVIQVFFLIMYFLLMKDYTHMILGQETQNLFLPDLLLRQHSRS